MLKKYQLTKSRKQGKIKRYCADNKGAGSLYPAPDVEDSMQEEYNPDIITLSDDEGHEFSFEVLDAVETDQGRYLALLPVYEKPEDMVEDSGELVVLKVFEENGEEYYEEIEDVDEYDTVADIFVDRLQDAFEIEEE